MSHGLRLVYYTFNIETPFKAWLTSAMLLPIRVEHENRNSRSRVLPCEVAMGKIKAVEMQAIFGSLDIATQSDSLFARVWRASL
jgi:hypothetical protein